MTSRCEKRPGAAAAKWCGARASGFTLIEILVVLSILGFALVLVIGYGPPVSRGLDLRGSAAALASGLRLARSEAIVRNQPVTFDLDLAGHRFRSGSGKALALPPPPAIAPLTLASHRP